MGRVNPRDQNDHRYWREMLGAYLLGGLDEDERTALEAHLDGCAECRAELAELRPVAAALADTDPDLFETDEPRPPADLQERTLSLIGHARNSELARRRQRRQRSALAAVAAVLLVAVGLLVVWPQFSAPPQEPLAFSEVAGGVEAEGSLIPHTWGTEASLLIEGLDEGRNYRAAFTTSDGSEVPAGTFIGTEAQPVDCNLNAAVLRENATQLEVRTMEGELIFEADLPEEPATS